MLTDTRDPLTIAVVLGDGVPLLEAAVPARVFGVDLSARGHPAYDVVVVSERPGRLTSTAGIVIEAPHPLAEAGRAGTVVVPGWRTPGGSPPAPEVIDAVRRAYDEGATVVGLCLGAFVLAEAGLLRGRRATTHWHFTDALARFPGVTVDGDVLYVDEGRVVTSAGSAAGIDACLYLLRRQRGADAANAVARALVVAPHRAGGQAQYVEHAVPEQLMGDALGAVSEHVLRNLDDPSMDVDALAARAHMSRRTFDRRFRLATGCSPLQWLLRQRILHAQQLLEVSDLGVDAVARRVGFADGVALRPHFRRLVGVPPQVYRETFRAG